MSKDSSVSVIDSCAAGSSPIVDYQTSTEGDFTKLLHTAPLTSQTERQNSAGLLSAAAHPFVALGSFIKHHIVITFSGDTPHLDIQFSPIVAFSCLLFLPVSYAFAVNGAFVMGAIMAAITLSSLFSDSLEPSSRFWCSADRILGTLGAIFGPLKAVVVAGTLLKKAEVILVLGGSLVFLAWSRQSKTQDEFIVRHTWWHIAGAAALTWLAFAIPIGP